MLRQTQRSFDASTMSVQQMRQGICWRLRFSVVGVAFLVSFVLMFVIARWNDVLIQSPNHAFNSPLEDEDILSLNRTVATLTKAFDNAGVTYFMTSGTLLGSYLHHGRIPWDDDVDLMVNSSDKQLVWNTLTALKPDYSLFLSGPMDSPYHWNFYPRFHGRWVPFRPFRWQFVDLLFFVENSTHVWNGSPNFPDERWPRRFVFPPRRRPFHELSLPAPCDTAMVLSINFDVNECRSRDSGHVYDLPLVRSAVAVPCSTLSARYPFVLTRHRLNGTSQHTASRCIRDTVARQPAHPTEDSCNWLLTSRDRSLFSLISSLVLTSTACERKHLL